MSPPNVPSASASAPSSIEGDVGPAAVSAEVTEEEAAELLNVSRAFLVALLDEGRIPSNGTGTQRRVPAAALIAYRAEDRKTRDDALRALTEEAERLGLGY